MDELRKKAMAILDRRPASREQLIKKLVEKGASHEQALQVAQWLCSIGALDDMKFAEDVARSYARKGYGAARVRSELYRRCLLYTSLGSMSSSDGGRISVEVEYPEEDAKYILRTYLGTDEDGTDYLVDEREVGQLDEDGEFSFTIPISGTAAPTGDYYITSCLLKEVSYTDNNGKQQKGYIAIDLSLIHI